MPFYSNSLLLKNIALALTFNTYNFPSTLADAGYTDAFVEYALVTTTLKQVSYDFGAVAPERNRSLVSEMKGGRYAQAEEQARFARQLTAYSELTSEDLINSGFRVAQGQNPSDHDHEVVVIGVDGEMQHIEPLVSAHSFQPPMLAAMIDRSGSPDEMPTYAGLIVYRGMLRDADLQWRLRPLGDTYPIPLPIPFDATSGDADIAATILPAILMRLLSSTKESYVVADDILRDVIDAWSAFGPAEQEAYRGRVNKLIRHAMSGREFRGVINWDNRRRSWRLEPLPTDPSKRQTRRGQLQRSAQSLVARLSGPSIQEPFAIDEGGI